MSASDYPDARGPLNHIALSVHSANATCSAHGRVRMPSEGWVP